MLQLEDGSTVEASDVEFGSSDEALLYENVLDMGLNAASANAFLNGYDGKLSAERYARGFREAYMYGEYGFPMSEISTEGFSQDLDAVQKHLAYNLGKANAEAKAEREDASLKGAIEKAKAATETGATVKKGGVRFEAGVRPKTAAQKHTVRLAKHLAKALGIDIVFYDTTLEGAKNTKDNGYYDPNDDSIHLDFQNAREDAKTIVFTLSHELVHFIKKWSPAKFKTFADFLMEQYAAHGVSASELLQNKMAALGTIDADLAYEELIADACERMLLDSDAVVKLMELRKAALNLFEKIKLHVLEILEKLRAVFNGVDPNTREGVALQNMVDVLDQIHAMFEDAAVDPAKTYQAVQESGREGLAIKRQAKALQQKDPTKLKEKDLIDLLQYAKDKLFSDGSFIPVRINTPQILIDFAREKGYTLENFPMAMRVYKARQAISSAEEWDGNPKDTPHNLAPEEIVEIIRAMNNPSYLVFQTKNERFAEIVKFDRGKEKAYAIIDFFDVNKNAEIMNGYEGGKYNILVTVYPSDNDQQLKNYLKSMENEIITGEEMKKKGQSQRGLGSYVPARLNDLPFFEDIIPQESDSVKRENIDGEKSQKKTVTNRTLLADALESTVKDEIERKRLTEYKEAITEIESAQEQLTEIRAKIKEMSFAKGPRDTKTINALRFEANKLANRISVLDGKLLRLESMGAIKGVLEREKARAYEKAKQEGKEALAAYRERAEQKQKELAARYQESRKKHAPFLYFKLNSTYILCLS